MRPELALIGGLALVMMLIAARGWRRRLLIVLAGGLLPVAYQIFRMGYYGLLVPGTALAKDASGDKWSQGFVYLANFNRALPAVGAGGAAGGARRAAAGGAQPAVVDRARAAAGYGRLARGGAEPAGRGGLHVSSAVCCRRVYWIRQGGDFMHGRVLLTPLFCLLAPVAVIPVVLAGRRKMLAAVPDTCWPAPPACCGSRSRAGRCGRRTRRGWAPTPPASPTPASSTSVGSTAQATGHAHPLTAADYLDYPRMRAVLTALNNTPDGALLLPSGNYDAVGCRARDTAAAGHAAGRPEGLHRAAHSVFHQPRACSA